MELQFSIYRRKVFTPNDRPDEVTSLQRTRAFEARYNHWACAFHW